MRIRGGVCEVTATARASTGCTRLRVWGWQFKGSRSPSERMQGPCGQGKERESRKLKPLFIRMGEG